MKYFSIILRVISVVIITFILDLFVDLESIELGDYAVMTLLFALLMICYYFIGYHDAKMGNKDNSQN